MLKRTSSHFLTNQGLASLKGRVFYGWWIVALGSLINGMGAGILFHSLTIFFLPLKNEFNASSAAISLFYGAARLEGGFESPVVGYLISRFGPRAMMITGILMAGGGLFLVSTVRDYWTFFFVFIFIVFMGYNAGFYHPVSTVMNNWFIRRRGVAFSLISSSAGAGGMVMAPLLSAIIAKYGWRTGMVVAGLAILIVTLPASFPMRNTPEGMGLRPDGEGSQDHLRREPGLGCADPRDVDFSVKEAMKTRMYWMLMGAISFRIFVTVALSVHFVPILVWKGMSETTGAYLVSLYAFGVIFTTLVIGWAGDRWGKALVSALGLLPIIVVMFGMVLSQGAFILYFYPIGLAIAIGTTPQNWALIGDFFGRRNYPTNRGSMGICYGTTGFFSPIYAGWMYDRTGGYTYVLISLSLMLVAVACLFAILRPPPPKNERSAPLVGLNS